MPEILIHKADILAWGRQKLAKTPSTLEEIDEWKEKLSTFSASLIHEDDLYVWLSCVEALSAVAEGNYGVGAILLDEKGNVLVSDHNKSFYPNFRTDLHAEMVVLNAWETSQENSPDLKHLDYRLISSLEPCPMCLTRLLYSDIKVISYAAKDNLGGMLRHIERMPLFFRETAQRHELGQAKASETLIKAAWQIMGISMERLNDRVS